MYICYIDESGTSSLSSNTSHFVLAGIAVPISQWKNSEKKIQKIKRKFLIEKAEIHTAWILRRCKQQEDINNFDSLSYSDRKDEVNKLRRAHLIQLSQNPRKSKQYHNYKKIYKQTEAYIHLTQSEREQFISEIAQLIGSFKKFRLFAECIDKIHYKPSIAPNTIDEQAFEQVVSRFESYLQIYTKTSKIKQYGLLVHDNNLTVSKKLTELMKVFHDAGTFWTKIKNIIETPLFVDSQLTSMIQIADLCAYALRRYIENSEDELFNEIIKIADEKNGKIVGVRHFTNSSCKCLICQHHKK